MNFKQFLISAFILVSTQTLCIGAQQYPLQINLPDKVTISGNTVNIGQLCKLNGQQALVDKASSIVLGTFLLPGQEIIIDRTLILSRLASNDIPASKVSITGEEKTIVKQQHQIIRANEIVALAESYLKNLPSYKKVQQMIPVQAPADLVVPGKDNEIKFSPLLAEGSSVNRARIQMAISVNGVETAKREITFRLKYNCRQAVTVNDIQAGTQIKEQYIRIQTVLSDFPEPADWKAPYNLIVKRNLPANTVIRPDMTGPQNSEIVVKRNQSVLIRIEKPGLLITAAGRTLQDGRVDEYIKVKNADSQKIIMARVNQDGTVEPVL